MVGRVQWNDEFGTDGEELAVFHDFSTQPDGAVFAAAVLRLRRIAEDLFDEREHGGTIFLSGIDWVDLLSMCTDLNESQHGGSKD